MTTQPFKVMITIVVLGALLVVGIVSYKTLCPTLQPPPAITEAVSADTTVYVEKRDTEVEALAYLMFEGVPTAKLKEFAEKPSVHSYVATQYLLRGYARVELACRLGTGYVVDIPKRGE